MAKRPSGDPAPSSGQVEELQSLVQAFVRSFGLLVTKQTPCGHPVSPSYAHALMALLEREGAEVETTQSDLGERLGIDKSNVARLCAKLHAEGHAIQEASPDDARSRQLRLTTKGRRMAEKIQSSSFERFRRVAAAVAPEQRQVLLDSLTALNAAVSTLEQEVA
jgi:DNA-binding MarR family transcriptional regulator